MKRIPVRLRHPLAALLAATLVLAAMSTVLGLIPIAPTVLWGPMAVAITGGLLAATVLTLILLPVLYVTLCGNEQLEQGAAGADVEPA